jgi:bifunctional UDP-N-acetylglucosamine pyrophosphorylase/glucosamine-1-phosphate N-acetyltransferase
MKNQKIIINNQDHLINFFKDDSLRMVSNSKIIFFEKLKLYSNITFEGNIFLGKNNTIGPNCLLNNVKIGNNNSIKMSSLLENSKICDQNVVGPFAYIRENTQINNKCIIGAYAEVTRSLIKDRCFASHQVFIGDSTINEGTIIGAGTIFCNYNFKTKSKKKIVVGSNCKIGSNTTIIAPAYVKPYSVIPASTKFKSNSKKK